MTAAPSMAEVLAEHAARWDRDVSYYMPVACECGVERPDGPGSDELWHAAHVAQALADAGYGHVASVEADSLRVAALAHAIECYAGPDDDTLPVLRWWLTHLRATLDGEGGR